MTPAKQARNAKSAAEADHLRSHPECRECLWPNVPDLSVVWVLGYPTTLCTNPWACWGRQLELREPDHGLIGS